jgi:hypothetical protein
MSGAGGCQEPARGRRKLSPRYHKSVKRVLKCDTSEADWTCASEERRVGAGAESGSGPGARSAGGSKGPEGAAGWGPAAGAACSVLSFCLYIHFLCMYVRAFVHAFCSPPLLAPSITLLAPDTLPSALKNHRIPWGGKGVGEGG